MQLVLLGALVCSGPLAINAYLPALPAVQRFFDASQAQAQATVAVPMLVFALALVICGPASDRFGRRPVLLTGSICFIIGSALAAVASSLTMLAAARAIQFIGGASGLIVSRAIVSDTYSGARETRMITVLGMVSLFGHAIAPPLAGYLVLHAGWRWIFAALCALGVVLLALAARGLPLDPPRAKPVERRERGGTYRALRSSQFLTGTLVIACMYASFSAFAALAPHVMTHAYGGDAAQYGRYYIVVPLGFIIGGLALLKIRGGVSERMLLIGFGLMTLGPVAGVAFALGGVMHPLGLFLPMGFACIGHAMVIPMISVRAVSQVAQRAGTGWGVLTFTQHSVAALAVQLTGAIRTDSPLPVLAICALVGACLWAFYWYSNRTNAPTAR